MIGLSRAIGSRAVKAGVPSATLPVAPSTGRWALSRIVQEADGGFRTAASIQGLTKDLDCYYPPLNATKTGYTQTHALVRLLGSIGTPDADTDLLPALALTDPLGADAATVRALLEARCPRYRYADWTKATVGKPMIPVAGYAPATPFSQVLADLWQHFEHSIARPKPNPPESHNTEHLDDFGSDTTANYTAKLGTIAHDGVNFEIDVGMVNNWGFCYSGTAPSAPGSIEHEAQCTFFYGTTANFGGTGGGAVRFHTTAATDDWYHWRCHDDTDSVRLRRINAGVASAELASRAFVFGPSVFLTLRAAAEGAAGANVVLTGWITDHGTSKPADPGWITATELAAFTDTAVDRLDDTTHALGGVSGHWQGVEVDSEHAPWRLARGVSTKYGVPKPSDLEPDR